MERTKTKKIVLYIGLGALLLFVLLGVINTKYRILCVYPVTHEYSHTSFTDYVDYCEIVAPSLLPLILSLPFSALLYFLPDEIFRAWWRFARWFVPLAVILTLLTPTDSGGGWGIPDLLDPEFVGIVFAFLFAALSLCIVVWKLIAVYYLKKGAGK